MTEAKPWPYPLWIAHRGAGKLAPENTLAAFRAGADWGYRMFECDVKLSADGTPFLLHDATLERTTDGHGLAGAQRWEQLARLDAGRWHSQEYVGEALPTLEAIARFCLDHGLLLNIEIKPSPGTDALTGEWVASAAESLWRSQSIPPLLSSFQPEALRAARARSPSLPRALLLDTLPEGWLDLATQLDCVAVIANYRLLDPELIALVHAKGMRCLTYTVNDDPEAARLLAAGIDGLITDRVDHFRPD